MAWRSAFVRAVAAALALALAWAAAPAAQAAAPAQEAGYRYWSFWELDAATGEWTYATQGPGTLRPGDGDVLGFRFVVSTDSGDGERPRGERDFAAICGDDSGNDAGNGEGDGESGAGRVGLVVDFGTAAHAPAGEEPPAPRTACADLADGATAAEALASVAEPLRYGAEGLLCAISGYPETGCAEQVDVDGDGNPAGGDTGRGDTAGGDEPGGISGVLGVTAGVTVVVLLALAALLRARRRDADG